MDIKEINLTVYELIASEGKKLTDGEGYYSRVHLSVLDNKSKYTEIDEADIPEEFPEEDSSENEEINTETDLM